MMSGFKEWSEIIYTPLNAKKIIQKFNHVTISSKGWIYHDTDFSGLNLGGQDFSRCRFYDCNFNDTDLRTTTFRETKFDGCTFNGADLRGNTSDEGLIVKDNCDLAGIKTDEKTSCVWKIRKMKDFFSKFKVSTFQKDGKTHVVMSEQAWDALIARLNQLEIKARNPAPCCPNRGGVGNCSVNGFGSDDLFL